MRITNLTRKNEIGANSYHVESNSNGYLLDSGTHPKLDGNESLPLIDLLVDKPVNAILVSHAHLDHIGSLPVVLAEHPESKAYLSHASCMIAERALHNSSSVMVKQRNELDLPEYPFFTHSEVDHVVDDFEPVPYARAFEVPGAEVTYHEAGHVMGAAGIWIQSQGQSLFYTGDVKFSDMRITRKAQFPDKRPDIMMIECTRGSNPAAAGFTWDGEIDRLALAIQQTFERGGSVLIPCFALGKTQEVLKVFYDLMQQGRLPRQPVFISGLSRSYTEIYDEMAKHHPRVCPGFELDKNLNIVVLDRKEALQMKIGKGRLMLISSGMMTKNTTSNLMARRMLHEPRNSIFFVGYVDPDSPAGKLKAAGQGGKADFGDDVGEVDVLCQVSSFDFTSHCNREHMLDYVVKIAPPNVLLVHGELTSLEWFKEQLREKLPQTKVFIPPSGETLEF